MISVVKSRKLDVNDVRLYVGTHNGIFHCDDILAIAMLYLLMQRISKNLCVIRSRDIEFLKENTDLLVDIGGGKYDHHQKGGNGERENGAKYASAGLIWKQFGSLIVESFLDSPLSQEEIDTIANSIDEEIIQKVDMEDNGQDVDYHPFQYITSFLPSWTEENKDYDKKFEECVNNVSVTLSNIIRNFIATYLAQKELNPMITNKETHFDNILVLTCQTVPWQDILVDYNEKNSDSPIDFVVFPHPSGDYALQCVPPSKKKKNDQRIPLPGEWAGETVNLPKISGVATATFCHNNKFFARASDYGDIIKMCRIATEKHRENGTTACEGKKDRFKR